MGLGSTAKKLQTVADQAEKLYGRMNEMREQLKDLKLTVEDTGERVQDLDTKVERQQVLIEALAEAQGIDVDALLAETAIEDADAVATNGDAVEDGDTADGAETADGSGTADAAAADE